MAAIMTTTKNTILTRTRSTGTTTMDLPDIRTFSAFMAASLAASKNGDRIVLTLQYE